VGSSLGMPQPITNYVREPYLTLETDALDKLPDMAVLVAKIFATWASIERDLNVLLVRLIGANSAPAHAIYSILRTQSLQSTALQAAAKSSLDPRFFDAFLAVMTILDGAKASRNKLAHWQWGKCKERPDLLVIADPDRLKEKDRDVIAWFQEFDPTSPKLKEWFENGFERMQFDPKHFIAFTKADLEREVRDLKQAAHILLMFGMVLDPSSGMANAKAFGLPEGREELREKLFARLNDEQLFRAALAQTAASRRSNGPPHGESRPPNPGE